MSRRVLILIFFANSGGLAQWQTHDPPTLDQSGMPFFAKAPDGSVYLSWVDPEKDREHALRFSRWNELAWDKPETVARGQNWFINWADFPALQILPDGAMLAHWLTRAEGGDAYGYGIRVARRGRDPRATWHEIAGMNLEDKSDYAGFLSFTGSAAAYLIPPTRPGKHTAHGHDEGHIKTLRFARFSANGVETDSELDSDVCSCCPTASAMTKSGLIVVYRDHLPGEIRDISFVRFRDGKWSAPQPLHRDGWKINGCPTEGPSIASLGDTVMIAWLTRASGTGRLNVAISRDGGFTFASPIQGDDGDPLGRPALLAVDAQQSLLVGLEKSEEGASVRLRRVYSSGSVAPAVTVANVAAARSSGFPKVAIDRHLVMVAWRDGRVRCAAAPLKTLPNR